MIIVCAVIAVSIIVIWRIPIWKRQKHALDFARSNSWLSTVGSRAIVFGHHGWWLTGKAGDEFFVGRRVDGPVYRFLVLDGLDQKRMLMGDSLLFGLDFPGAGYARSMYNHVHNEMRKEKRIS